MGFFRPGKCAHVSLLCAVLLSSAGARAWNTGETMLKGHWTTLLCGGYAAKWRVVRQGGTVCVDPKLNSYLVFTGGLGISPAPVLGQVSMILIKSEGEVEGAYIGVKGGYAHGRFGGFAGGYAKPSPFSGTGRDHAFVVGASGSIKSDYGPAAEASSEWLIILPMN